MRLLILSGYNEWAGSPNFLCVKNLFRALSDIDNVQVDIAGDKLSNEFPQKDWRKNPVFAIRRVLRWPIHDPDGADMCFDDALKHVQQNKYDAIIAFHNPYEAVEVGIRLKKIFPDLLFVIFEIDPITNAIDANIGLGSKLKSLTIKAERKAFTYADLIIHMVSNKNKYSSKYYKEYYNKTEYVDLPLINNIVSYHCYPFEKNEEISIIFSGRISSLYRSPNYILHLLDIISREMKIHVAFYSKGDCQEDLKRYSLEHDYIEVNDYVAEEILDEKMKEASVLLNIGNRMSDMLPSKMFKYISFRKPIIHISTQQNDACIPYLRKYGLSLVLNENDSVKENVHKLKEFLIDVNGKIADGNIIKERFKENRPDYIAEKIVRLIDENKRNRNI